MRKINVIYMVVLTFMTLNVYGQSITWTKKSNLPIPISKAKAAVVGEKIYIIGGITPTFRGFNNSNYEYNPTTDKWSKKKNMPTGRTNYAIAVVHDKIYVIGGDPFSNKVEVYDPKTDTWDSLSNMPSKRQHVSCTVVDDKIYVIGGFEDICCPPYPQRCNWETCAKISVLNQVYDTNTDTWEILSPLTSPKHGHEVISVGGKIYVIGGMGNDKSIWAPLNTVEEYDPQTDTWQSKKEMPAPRDGFGYSVQDQMIYLFGGWIDERKQTDITYVYDIKSNTWSTSTTLVTKTGACGYATIGNKVYLFGGDKEDYSEIFSFTYEGEIKE